MLPKRRIRATNDEHETSPAFPASGTRPGPFVGRTVLVVDPAPDFRELIAILLVRVGARGVLASTVDEALVHIERTRIDAVLTEVALPERDGYALLAEVRQRCPGVPVVAVTGYLARPRSARERNGFDAMVVKPVDPTSLFMSLANALGAS